jgi:hypothetical protein
MTMLNYYFCNVAFTYNYLYSNEKACPSASLDDWPSPYYYLNYSLLKLN